MSAVQLIFFTCGQIGIMMLTRFLFQWIVYFEADKAVGPPLAFPLLGVVFSVGFLFLLFRIFDAATDPLAGAASDAWVKRKRERRHLLWFAMLLPPVGLAMCFAPHTGMENGTRWVVMVVGMLLFFVGYTFYAIPYWSLVQDYSGNSDKRRVILSNLLGLGSMIATGIGFTISPPLIEPSQELVVGSLPESGKNVYAIVAQQEGFQIRVFDAKSAKIRDVRTSEMGEEKAKELNELREVFAKYSESKSKSLIEKDLLLSMSSVVGYSPADYFGGAIIFGVGGLFLMILPIFAQPKDAVISVPDESTKTSPWLGIRSAFRNRRFVALIMLFGGSQMSFTFMTTASAFIAVDLLNGTKSDVSVIMAPFLGSAFVFFLVVPILKRKFGWEKCMVGASLYLGAVYGLTAGLGTAVIGSVWTTAVLVFLVGGPGAAVLLGLEGEAISDCAESSGDPDVTGMYWGVFNFFVKGVNGLAVFIGSILAAYREEIGATAVRYMSGAAGGTLILGVLLYILIKVIWPAPKKEA